MTFRITATIACTLLAMPMAVMAQAPVPLDLVKAYTDQLARQCQAPGDTQPPRAVPVERVDLNGDKLQDWIVDANRYPCPTRAGAFANDPQNVTVFLASKEGAVRVGLQKRAFGSQVRTVNGVPSLILSLAGFDCGENSEPTARCDLRYAASADSNRLEVMRPAAARR